MGQTRKRAFNALLTLLGDSNDPFENFMDAADAKRFKEENKQAPTSPMGSDYVEGDVIEKNPAEEDELEALGSDEDRNEDNDEALDDGSDSAVERDSAKLEIQGIQPLREDEEDDADEEDAEDALDDDDAYTDAAAAVHAPAASSAPSGDRTDEPEDARDPFEAHFADPGSFEAPEEWKSLYIDTLPQLGARGREGRRMRLSRAAYRSTDRVLGSSGGDVWLVWWLKWYGIRAMPPQLLCRLWDQYFAVRRVPPHVSEVHAFNCLVVVRENVTKLLELDQSEIRQFLSHVPKSIDIEAVVSEARTLRIDYAQRDDP